ncbi:MAG: aspartate kinase [Bdellovibrionales bacterium]
MSLLVLKFGAASVADIEGLKNAASKVAQEVRLGHKVVVVVSAAAGDTDKLMTTCRRVSPRPNPREYDAIVATGEQISAGYMALALEQRGLNARSWQGWQLPIRTNSAYGKAQILDIDTSALRARLEEGEVAVLAGFQGLAKDNSITTLGQGGTDLTAIAIAASLKADRCDIYTKTAGVHTAKPQLVSRATRLKRISYKEILELSALGVTGLTTRALKIALQHNVPIQILAAFGNDIGSDLPGTLITSEDQIMETKPVTGIAHSRDIARITIKEIQDRPGSAAQVFGALSRAGLNIDMIVQPIATGGKTTELTIAIAEEDLPRALQALEDDKDEIKFSALEAEKNVAKISLVGSGMRGRSNVAALAFRTLAEKNINIELIETSEISLTILIAEDYLELALRTLHTAFELDS